MKLIEYESEVRRNHGGVVYVKITHQHAIGKDIKHNHPTEDCTFVASNGILLTSDGQPAYSAWDAYRVYLWGRGTAMNSSAIIMPRHIFRMFEEAVKEYNAQERLLDF